MESKLANQARQQLIEQSKKMTPEERLRAYVEHVKVLAQIHAAGVSARKRDRNLKP